MEEDEATKHGSGELSDNPLTTHLVVMRMNELMDNLKLLDYENAFCRQLKFKPLPR